MRPLVAFDAAAPDWRVRDGRAARLRTDALVLFLALAPGVAFVRQRSGFVLGMRADGGAEATTLGAWMMLPDLTTPATQTVLPMNDALYGACHVELDRQGPMVLHVPADEDSRYFSVAVMDAHFTNVAHLGPRWTGRGSYDVLIAPPDWEGAVPDGMRLIRVPTPSACLLHRALVRYDAGDIDRVRAWRTGFSLKPWDATAGEAATEDLLHPTIATLEDPWEYFRIGLDHLARNPFPREMAWVLDAVDVDGLMAAHEDDWARLAVLDGIDDAQALVDATLTTWPTVDGWRRPFPWVGLPNSRIVENAALQLYQVGSNDAAEAMYFFSGQDAEGLPLDCSRGVVYEVAFAPGRQPPVDVEGFWSLTMYGPDNLLVDNPIDRYSTRPTRPGFAPRADGTVAFVVSAQLPDGIDEAAWLPAPAGRFQLGLRLYYPLPDAREGAWFPPAVRRVR